MITDGFWDSLRVTLVDKIVFTFFATDQPSSYIFLFQRSSSYLLINKEIKDQIDFLPDLFPILEFCMFLILLVSFFN